MGGIAALQGMLHVGDTIIAVDGVPLKGERIAVALNAGLAAAGYNWAPTLSALRQATVPFWLRMW